MRRRRTACEPQSMIHKLQFAEANSSSHWSSALGVSERVRERENMGRSGGGDDE